MVYRYKPAYGLRLYMCTNDPEVCDFMTNDYGAGDLPIMKCDRCQGGFLIAKKGPAGYFLGCTNYKKDGSGCKNSMSRSAYEKIRYY